MDIHLLDGLLFLGDKGFVRGDVVLRDGIIRAVGPESAGRAGADIRIDASGCIVSPGLIDFHCHLLFDASAHGCYGDLCAIPGGVTTLVDAGTAGTATYEGFRRLVGQNSRVNVFSFLNVSPTGMVALTVPEEIEPGLFDRKELRRLLAAYPDVIVGLKIRLARKVLRREGEAPLLEALKLARELGRPAVVHVSECPIPARTVLDVLEKGDVYCHCFTDKDCLIVGEAGEVIPEALRARERGVVFDMANGGHFSLAVAGLAIGQGFFPDIVSTDETFVSMYREPVFSLPYVMSKLHCLGMPLERIFRAVTLTPAALLGRAGELGTLEPGARADVSVFRLTEHRLTFSDHAGGTLAGDTVIRPLLTVKDGVVLYRDLCF